MNGIDTTLFKDIDEPGLATLDVYVCTNISCSLRGADAVYDAMLSAAGDDPDFAVKKFECLGACDIAPMASVDGVYVGPIELGEVDELIDDIRNERPPLPAKQLKIRPSADAIPLDPERAIPAPPTSYGEEG